MRLCGHRSCGAAPFPKPGLCPGSVSHASSGCWAGSFLLIPVGHYFCGVLLPFPPLHIVSTLNSFQLILWVQSALSSPWLVWWLRESTTAGTSRCLVFQGQRDVWVKSDLVGDIFRKSDDAIQKSGFRWDRVLWKKLSLQNPKYKVSSFMTSLGKGERAGWRFRGVYL